MFEKESKEYANKWLYHVKDLELHHKEDDKPEYIRILEAHQQGAEFGYNKANEWHYVKDELPPIKKEYNGRSELVLVLSKEKEMQYAQYVEKEKTWARGICEISFKPYAWKEIVLPKESE